MSAIRPGQEYVACAPMPSMPGEVYTRIRVVGRPVTTPGLYGFGKVRVATLTESGRELRPRAIKTTQLHPTGLAASGQPRKTGYRLVKDGGEAR